MGSPAAAGRCMTRVIPFERSVPANVGSGDVPIVYQSGSWGFGLERLDDDPFLYMFRV
jgi:hypothetical protein